MSANLEKLNEKEFDQKLKFYLRKYISEEMYETAPQSVPTAAEPEKRKYSRFSQKLNENPSFASVVASYISLRLQEQSSRHTLILSIVSVSASIIAVGITILNVFK